MLPFSTRLAVYLRNGSVYNSQPHINLSMRKILPCLRNERWINKLRWKPWVCPGRHQSKVNLSCFLLAHRWFDIISPLCVHIPNVTLCFPCHVFYRFGCVFATGLVQSLLFRPPIVKLSQLVLYEKYIVISRQWEKMKWVTRKTTSLWGETSSKVSF